MAGGSRRKWLYGYVYLVVFVVNPFVTQTNSIFDSVFRAVNISEHRVAACKLILLTETTSDKGRKNVEKEMRVHSALKHQHVLEFLNAVVVELKHKATYVPGIYMLLEFAGGGDLFDKIGASLLPFQMTAFQQLPFQLRMLV